MYIMPLNSYFLAPSAMRISRATNGIEGIVLLSATQRFPCCASAVPVVPRRPVLPSVLQPLG